MQGSICIYHERLKVVVISFRYNQPGGNFVRSTYTLEALGRPMIDFVPFGSELSTMGKIISKKMAEFEFAFRK